MKKKQENMKKMVLVVVQVSSHDAGKGERGEGQREEESGGRNSNLHRVPVVVK